MSIWSFYSCDNGLFAPRQYSGPADEVEAHTPLGFVAIEGAYSPTRHFVDLSTIYLSSNTAPAVLPYKPPPPADDQWQTWRWNEAAWQWDSVPTEAALWREVRRQRSQMLAACDWVVARAAERGELVPEPWCGYRQALRDVTLQPDPMAIAWPTPPA